MSNLSSGIEQTGALTTHPLVVEAASAMVSARELVDLCALDSDLYCKTFFPSTFRQFTPPFHRQMDERLEDPRLRHVGIEVFRGGAKTTKLRAYLSKRIAYGITHTALFVSASQDFSKKSLQWIKKAIEYNTLWTSVFGLAKGDKWTEEVCEIYHTKLGFPITIVAAGITGQVRGLNIDDYRPDLIIVDDPLTEENTATPEQRFKIEELFFGALEKSLAPASESPDAKMVLLQTSLNADDLINRCHRDPQWNTLKFSCFDEKGESRWPVRFPTETLRAEKQAHIERGQLPLWLREMECTIVSSESSAFKPEWLQYYDLAPEGMATILSIDPVPPPSDRQTATGFRDKDYEVLSVVGLKGSRRFLLEYAMSRGHEPEWTVNEFFRLVDKWRPLKAKVEGIAYQRALKWILEKAMRERRRYVQIDAEADKRPKAQRIVQAFSGIASQKLFYVNSGMSEFLEQFLAYPNTKHDDLLDAVASGLDGLIELDGYDGEGDGGGETDAGALRGWRQAP